MKRILMYLVFLAFQVQGQIQILEAYVAEGIDRNKDFLSHQMLHHAFLEKEMQFSRLSDLQLSAGFAPSPIETRLGAQKMQFSAVQRFPWFGTLDAKLNLFEAENEVHNKVLQMMGGVLQHKIEKAWYKLYEIRLNKIILKDRIELIEMMESLTKEHMKTKSNIGMVDLLTIQFQKEEWENSLLDLLDAEKVQQYAFNTLLSKEIHTEVITVDSLVDLMGFDPILNRELYAVNKQKLKVEVAKESMELFKKTTKPTWTIGFRYFMIDEIAMDIPDNGKDAYMFNIGLNIPFQIKQNKHTLMEATHKWHTEAINLEHIQDEYNLLLAKVDLEIKKQVRNFHSNSRLKEKIKQTTSLLLQEYKHGNNSYNELLKSMGLLLDLERKEIAAIVQQHIQLSYYQSLFELRKNKD